MTWKLPGTFRRDASDGPGAPPAAPCWRTVGLGLAWGLTAAAVPLKVAPALPALGEEFDLDLQAVGWVAGAVGTIGLVLGAVVGVTAQRLGPRQVVPISLVLLVAGAVLATMAESVTVLVASRLVEGLGFMLVAVTLPGLLRAATPVGRRRLVFALAGVLVPAGAMIVLLAAPVLMPHGWRVYWLAVAAVSGLVSLLLLGQVSRAPPVASDQPAEAEICSLTRLLGQPALWGLAGGFGGYAFMWVSVVIWLPFFLVEARDLSLGTASLLTALVAAANVPGYLVAGWFRGHGLPPGRLIGAAALCMGICVPGIFANMLPDPARYGLCLLFSFTGGMLPASALAGVGDIVPRLHQGPATGLVLQGAQLGLVLGPPTVGTVVLLGGWAATADIMLAAAIVSASCGVLLGFVRR